MENFKKIFIIGEIGINHNGDIKNAIKLIDGAKDCGFDAVKFQKRTPKITTPQAKKNLIKETPWGRISYLDYKKKIEFNKKEFDIIDKHCKKIKMTWFASAWDIDSAKFLEQYKLKYNKVASPVLTNLKLLEFIAKQKKYTFLSTGMCKMKDIDNAVNIFKKFNCKFGLMHCVSTYPAKEEDLNLSLINIYKKKYKVDIGYSGHEKSVSPGLMAACLGARFVERHITLNRAMWGTDQAASLEISGMKILFETIRKFEICYGDGKKVFLADEKKKLKENKYW